MLTLNAPTRPWLQAAMLALVLLVLLGFAAVAEPLPPVPLERFFQQRAVLDAQLSPSGRQVAIITARGAKRVGLVVITLGVTPTARGVANFDDADIVSFSWVSDERLVFSLADLQYGSGEYYDRSPGLYAVDADGSKFKQLIRRSGTAVVQGEKLSEALDANHYLLHVPTQQAGVTPDEIIIGGADFSARQFVGYKPMWLNTRSGNTRPIALPGGAGLASSWFFDSKGEARAALTRTGGSTTLRWRGQGDSAWRVLAEYETLASKYQPFEVGDDGTLYVTHPVGPEGFDVLARFDFSTRAPAAQALVSTPGFDFRGSLVAGEPGAPPLGVRVNTDAAGTVWFDESMKRLQATVDQRLPGHVNRIDCRRCTQPDAVALVRSSADTDPGRLLIYEAATQRWQVLASVMEGIDPRRMATVDFQRIKARDGRDLPVWLTLPVGVPAGQAAPTVVMAHSGPWVRGSSWVWTAMEQFLASRGYLVISPEYRGSKGFGDAHYRAGWKQFGQAMQDDLADALLWAQAQGLASKQACILGSNYGGYAALMGLVRHPELYRCGIAWGAMTDTLLFLKGESTVTDQVSRWGRQYELRMMIGDPDKDAAMLTAVSPLAQVERIRAPVLLAYGEKGLEVPLVHGLRLRDALKAAGRTPEWVSYPNEAHGRDALATRIDFARRIEAFLARHLGPEAAH